MVYSAHLRTRKSPGDMMRKLSVTLSQSVLHLLGTSRRRKPSTASQKLHGFAEAVVSGMTSVVGHVLVHQSPEPLDRVQMRAVDRHEMAPDPPAWHGQPVLNRPGVMIAGIVQKHMDDPHRRVQGLDRDQESDRAPGVDRHHLDHAGL